MKSFKSLFVLSLMVFTLNLNTGCKAFKKLLGKDCGSCPKFSQVEQVADPVCLEEVEQQQQVTP